MSLCVNLALERFMQFHQRVRMDVRVPPKSRYQIVGNVILRIYQKFQNLLKIRNNRRRKPLDRTEYLSDQMSSEISIRQLQISCEFWDQRVDFRFVEQRRNDV
jgi:hypothetical protein